MQEAGIKFKDPITSFGANAKYSGLIASARYRGFDVITDPSGLTFNLAHTVTGEIFTNLNLTLSNPKGIWVSKQGTVIKEDSAIALTIETNTGNSQPRIDLVIGKHYHDIIAPGGVNASYHIIKGPLESNTVPAITIDPEQSVILGKLYILANGSSMASVTYVPEKAQALGGKLPAVLSESNRMTGQQQDFQTSNITVISTDYELAARGVILALDNGNTFKAEDGFAYLDLLPNKPNGTEINIHFIKPITIRSTIENLVGGTGGVGQRAGYTAGMRSILLSNTPAKEITIQAQQIVKFLKVSVDGSFSAGTPIYGDVWKLVSISDSPLKIKELETDAAAKTVAITDLQTSITTLTNLINNINPPRSIRWVDFAGAINDHFDINGKAKSDSPYYGYHIANGNGGTSNYKGRMLVGFDPGQMEFSVIGSIGGAKTVALTSNNNGPHTHNVATATRNRGSSSSGGNLANQEDTASPWAVIAASSGLGTPHENMSPYITSLPLMWIGIP